MVDSSLRIEPYPFLKGGGWVRVRSGPLMDLKKILHHKKNLYRVVLSVEMLQKSVAVEVDAASVERVAKDRSARDVGQRNKETDYVKGRPCRVLT